MAESSNAGREMGSLGIRLALVLLVGWILPTGAASVWGEMESRLIEAWARVLAEHHRAGGLDYASLQGDREDLDAFVAGLADIDPTPWSREERIAFWCNAYNAVVAHQVLEWFPELTSVKEVPGFFDEQRSLVAGRQMTLDDIESEARALDEPRVHFAVVCASTSCPDLRGEPYHGEILERQLEEDTRAFLADPDKGLSWDPQSNTLYLSSIFMWYAGDFTGGSTVVAFFSRGKVLDWILPHLPAALATELAKVGPKIRYLEYDWSLNDRPRS